MPVTPTYPGVYIEEIPSGVRTIIGVATSITAFIGRASRGPTDLPVRIQNFGDYERVFGGLVIDSSMSYAVQQFFLNGGTDAIIIRVAHTDQAAAKSFAAADLDAGGLKLQAGFQDALNPGKWGNNLAAIVDVTDTADPNSSDQLFNLYVAEVRTDPNDPKKTLPVAIETFRNLTINKDKARYVGKVLQQESLLVKLKADPTVRPTEKKPKIPPPPARPNPAFTDKGEYYAATQNGNDGVDLDPKDINGPGKQNAKAGLYALEKADLFNLLCIPPLVRSTNESPPADLYSAALTYCQGRRAMLLVDPPTGWGNVSTAEAMAGVPVGAETINAAVFFPRLRAPDPLKENRLEDFVPCGAMAGLFARTDAQRGVWKAPAGIDATLTGVSELTVKMTDPENGRLNPLGVNCLRTFPLVGNVSWGARTLRGADRLASEWKYIPVRRTALFIEESLYRGTQFAVFEPNDEPLWAQIRLNVGAFMQNLFRQGAFQGRTPREAYLVKCDNETTIQNDIDRGIVNVIVGFAPLKPAEFVIIKIQQLAGQIQT